MFVSKCFDGVRMQSASSRLIVRILKSFSVRFVSDFVYYLKSSGNPDSQSLGLTNRSTLLNSLISSSQQLGQSSWTIENGMFIIDIKSTHLVKFEDYSFSSLQLKSGAKFYLDLELIEKLMYQRYSFGNLNVQGSSRVVNFAKQITFIDFRAYSFAGLTVDQDSQVEVYLEELTSSLCLQRNVFSNMRLQRGASFNFSVINSKNVQLMHDSFSNATLDQSNARVHIGVYNMPSYLLLFYNQNYYKYVSLF